MCKTPTAVVFTRACSLTRPPPVTTVNRPPDSTYGHGVVYHRDRPIRVRIIIRITRLAFQPANGRRFWKNTNQNDYYRTTSVSYGINLSLPIVSCSHEGIFTTALLYTIIFEIFKNLASVFLKKISKHLPINVYYLIQ